MHADADKAADWLSRAALDSLPDPVVVVDASSHLLGLNATARRTFECPVAADPNAPETPSPHLVEVLRQIRLPSPGQGGVESPQRLQVRCGPSSARPMLAGVTSFVHQGATYHTILFRDLSGQNSIEQALLQAQKHQAIGALASGVAHDFNNILTAILSHLDLVLLGGDLPGELQDHVRLAQTSARRGAELIGKLLTFSRHSDQRLAPLDLPGLVEEVVIMLRRTIDPRIQIRQPGAVDAVWPVLADATQVMQVLMNLCLNARDAMPQGGELSLELANVRFGSAEASPPRHAGDFVRVTVGDTGEGISPEVLTRVFEPYFTTKNFGRGTGLGLSISHNILHQHNGWMEVESRVGFGSQFHAFLPRSPQMEPAHGAQDYPRRTVTQNLEGQERILVVDDDELVRLVIRAVLSYRGYQISEAAHGEQACELYAAAQPRFDLVLLDLHMPRMNGWDALAHIRALDPQAKVVLLTGGPIDGVGDRANEFGAVRFLSKPFENQEMVRLVRETLDSPAT